MTTPDTQLLSLEERCPFCGARYIEVHDRPGRMHEAHDLAYVKCLACTATGPAVVATEWDNSASPHRLTEDCRRAAIAVWLMRPTLKQKPSWLIAQMAMLMHCPNKEYTPVGLLLLQAANRLSEQGR